MLPSDVARIGLRIGVILLFRKLFFYVGLSLYHLHFAFKSYQHIECVHLCFMMLLLNIHSIVDKSKFTGCEKVYVHLIGKVS